MGWFIAALVLAGLAILPVGIRMLYSDGGAFMWLTAGPFRMKLYPGRKKHEKKEKRKKSVKTEDRPASAKTSVKQGKLQKFMPYLRILVDFLEELPRKLVVRNLEFKCILAGGDPCDLACNYGRAWAAISGLMPLADRMFRIRKRRVEMECDFTADKMLIFAQADITIPLGRLLALIAVYCFRVAGVYRNQKNLNKGGAEV